MQLFILLYIEAGSYIHEDEEGWEFAVLYVLVLNKKRFQEINILLSGMKNANDATNQQRRFITLSVTPRYSLFTASSV